MDLIWFRHSVTADLGLFYPDCAVIHPFHSNSYYPLLDEVLVEKYINWVPEGHPAEDDDGPDNDLAKYIILMHVKTGRTRLLIESPRDRDQ